MTDPQQAVPESAKQVQDGVSEGEKSVLDEQRYVTGRIGETCRYISFGLLAIFYSIQNSDSIFSAGLRSRFPYALEIMALFAASAILFDYLQYVTGNASVKKALARESHEYDKTWISYRLRSFFYFWKQWLALASALILIVVMALALLLPALCTAA